MLPASEGFRLAGRFFRARMPKGGIKWHHVHRARSPWRRSPPKDEEARKADPIGMQGFYYDPENNPLDTPSGKIEFYSTSIHEHWPNDPERPEVPHWVEESDEHHERVTSDRAKDYPFLLMSNRPR